MDDLREEFIAETRETLQILSQQLVLWERVPDDHSLVDSVFRFVHTVKGSCGFLDLPRLLRLSHAAEEVLSAARDGNLVPSPDLVTAVLKVIDRISALTDALETGAAVQDDDGALIADMLSFLPSLDTHPTQSTKSVADDDIVAEVEFDDTVLRNRGRTVRVSLTLLDKLMNGISDLVLSRNEVLRQLRRCDLPADVDNAFTRLSSSVAEMRDAIGQMRLQNIDKLFSSLPRALRDICIELDKNIDLVIEGNEVEIDREMVEAMRDPLTHILRNAADHGIEPAGERLSAGKSVAGRIHIVARQSGNQILVEITDDGRGIDVERLGEKAIERKVYTQSQWAKLSERAKLETIFLPGLSTAKAVSAISGRGVGMDVVRTNIHAIGGTIDLENGEGSGLKVTLCLPLTLSIIAGISVKAGNQFFGISRSSIVEILSINNRNVTIENIGGMSVAKIRQRRLAYATLESVLGLDMPDECPDTARTLVIIRPAVGVTFALEVAAVVDNEELVVKPGAPLVMATGLFAGTTLPDNGCPMLLLDANGLAEAMGAQQDLFMEHDEEQQEAADAQGDHADSALLFVGTDGVTRAIRLALVDRMEEIAPDHVHHLGGRHCVSVNELIYDIYGLNGLYDTGPVKVLRLSDGQQSFYLAVNDVLDIFAIPSTIARSVSPGTCEGIVHFEGAPIELVSAFQFFESSDVRSVGQHSGPICFLDISKDDIWTKRILQPLLTASGYRVTFEESERELAAVILCPAGAVDVPSEDKTLLLRDTVHPMAAQSGSIYRYDRLALISAIEAKIAGAC